MHIGLMMECDYRSGKTQEEAFDEAFSTAITPRSGVSMGSGWPNVTSLPPKVGEPSLQSWRPH